MNFSTVVKNQFIMRISLPDRARRKMPILPWVSPHSVASTWLAAVMLQLCASACSCCRNLPWIPRCYMCRAPPSGKEQLPWLQRTGTPSRGQAGPLPWPLQLPCSNSWAQPTPSGLDSSVGCLQSTANSCRCSGLMLLKYMPKSKTCLPIVMVQICLTSWREHKSSRKISIRIIRRCCIQNSMGSDVDNPVDVDNWNFPKWVPEQKFEQHTFLICPHLCSHLLSFLHWNRTGEPIFCRTQSWRILTRTCSSFCLQLSQCRLTTQAWRSFAFPCSLQFVSFVWGRSVLHTF